MSDLKLKQNGLRFLDSRAGDLLVADPRLGMQLLFASEFLEQVENDPQKMMMFGKRLLEFLKKHTAARWRFVEKQLNDLEQKFPDFVTKYREKLSTRTIDNLRKLEKDIYFFIKSHE